ncbi:MAG: hypothetical protein ACLFS9_04270 [Nitriliruptoraceae bacterium]
MTRSSSDAWGTEVDAPILQQTGPERFELLRGDGHRYRLRLAHHTRRGLGLTGVPPLQVATEAVRILVERGHLEQALDARGDGQELDLGAAVGQDPAGFEELRMRLS